MALGAEDLATIRKVFYRVRDQIVGYTKADLNSAADAMHNWISDNQASAAAAMEAAAPGVFDAMEKRRIGAAVFEHTFREDLV